MTLLIFIPALLSVAGLIRWGAAGTLRNVCLPVMLLLPTYFYWKMDGAPGLDFTSAALLPLGVAMIPAMWARWRFSRSDLWMLAYILSSAVADLRAGGTSLAKYRLFDVIVAAVIPYMAGKLLIEQGGARLATARRIALILCLSCLGAIPEFFIKINLFSRVGMHLFPTEWPGWWTQVRWGFGRVAGPYGTAEIYGLILLMALLLLLWVHKAGSTDLQSSRIPFVSSKRTIQCCLLLLGTTLLMTQSRGPWLGALLAIPVALVGRAKHVKRAAVLLAVVVCVAAIPAYIAGRHYVSGPRQQFGSEQETAQYRHQLLLNYLPVAEKGGLWGWGTFPPVLESQTSIDNEFLRVFLVQGYVGVVSYMLLIFEAGYRLIRLAWAATSSQDRHFSFTLLGIFAGWVITLSTVYMGAQSYQLFFLLVGWTQAMVWGALEARSPAKSSRETLSGEPPLTQVYT